MREKVTDDFVREKKSQMKEDKEKEKQKKRLDKNQNGIENEKIMID
jgi:hypothetical protein